MAAGTVGQEGADWWGRYCIVRHCRHAHGDASGRRCRQGQEKAGKPEAEPWHVEEEPERVGWELHG
jgi:hypothetical protein